MFSLTSSISLGSLVGTARRVNHHSGRKHSSKTCHVPPILRSRRKMEHDFFIPGLLRADHEGVHVSVWDGDALARLERTTRSNMAEVVNEAGAMSARAQGLGSAVTDWVRLAMGNQRLYIAAERSRMTESSRGVAIVGFLKTGKKRLFLRRHDGGSHMEQVEPICILDFYVHESQQRKGIGRMLMNVFTRDQNVDPARTAIDRPSKKMLAFLYRHYGLADYVQQANNYVVFRKFWEDKDGTNYNNTNGSYHTPQRAELRAQNKDWMSISQRPLSGKRRYARRLRENNNANRGAEAMQTTTSSPSSSSSSSLRSSKPVYGRRANPHDITYSPENKYAGRRSNRASPQLEVESNNWQQHSPDSYKRERRKENAHYANYDSSPLSPLSSAVQGQHHFGAAAMKVEGMRSRQDYNAEERVIRHGRRASQNTTTTFTPMQPSALSPNRRNEALAYDLITHRVKLN